MTITARAQRPGGSVRALGAVTVGTLLANLLAYVVQVPASRVLGPDGFGEFSVLNAAMLVLSVPALALQAVVAREVVTGTSRRRLWRLTGVVGVLVAIGSAVGVGVMMQIAHTSWSTTLAALAGAAPLAVIAGGQGFLQGTGRFGLLGGVLAGVGVAKSVPVVVALALGAGPTGALAAGTVGTVIAAVAVAGVAVGGTRATDAGRSPSDGRARPPVSMVDVLSASSVQFVMIVAVSVDLLLSRAVLSADDAGVYALGAVATKAAFWLPQAIGVVVYPRLADPVRSADALRRAVGVLAAIGCTVTVLAAACGPLVPVVISDDYRPVAAWMWLFALTGSLLAVLQLMLLAAIARNRARGAVPAFVALVVEVVLIVTVADSVVTLATIAAGAAAVAVVATWAWVRSADG
ncbi:polysaccharide biosynthesis protein [Gordonia sp. HY002]|uniref:lipopolysaccharide biosynthesis protein n=1 Tax=Gordonia zhenghanii TaxID=2911516 RepID=UPI001F460933|nr:polysaccharide biosynthesis protein [Gordonia zhenghanii]MCF8569239.1 polysaccharide biosynthesis protein [Gordonia zhenghanii]